MTGSVLRGMPLIVDATGVGRAVCDLIEERGLSTSIVSRSQAVTKKTEWTAVAPCTSPSLQLLSHLESALHLAELRVAQGLAEGEAFKSELLNFRVTRTDSGNVSMNARNGAHDDIVLSVALALYFLRRRRSDGWSAQTLHI